LRVQNPKYSVYIRTVSLKNVEVYPENSSSSKFLLWTTLWRKWEDHGKNLHHCHNFRFYSQCGNFGGLLNIRWTSHGQNWHAVRP